VPACLPLPPCDEGQEITSLWSIQPKETIIVSEGEEFKPRKRPSKGLSGTGMHGSPPKLRAAQHHRRTETKGEALDDIAAYSRNPYLRRKGFQDPRGDDEPLHAAGTAGGRGGGGASTARDPSQERSMAATAVKEPSRCTSAKRVKRLYVRPNDAGAGTEKAVVEASTLTGFLDAASIQLGLACPLTRLFDCFGREVLALYSTYSTYVHIW